MKYFSMLSLTLATALFLGACGNEEYGSSTPIDSTNLNGTAPAQYSSEKPGSRDSSQFQDTEEIFRNIDSNGNEGGTARPGGNGNGANSSNTTDRRTTSGSANNGDADGDRKK